MLAVFSVIFSGMVTSYNQKYGPIGIVFGLMSFFIAIGVVIILGAAVGLMSGKTAACPSVAADQETTAGRSLDGPVRSGFPARQGPV